MKHPDWCAKDHRCTVGRLPEGEHRAAPETWRTEYGTLVVTRIRDARGREWLETNTVVRLSAVPDRARRQSQHLAVGVDLTVRAVLAGVARTDLLDDLADRVPALGVSESAKPMAVAARP